MRNETKTILELLDIMPEPVKTSIILDLVESALTKAKKEHDLTPLVVPTQLLLATFVISKEGSEKFFGGLNELEDMQSALDKLRGNAEGK